MKLCEMRIKDKEVIYFKFISERLSLPILNGYFEKYSNDIGDVSFRKYPRLENSDYVRIEDGGKTLIYRENDDTYIYVVDIDNGLMSEYKSLIRNFKIENIIK
jgi:hypothetical protein